MKRTVTIRLYGRLLEEMDSLIEQGIYRNRPHFLEQASKHEIERHYTREEQIIKVKEE